MDGWGGAGQHGARPPLTAAPPPPPPLAAQEERTQGRNRERAMALLRAKLFELELEKQRRWGCGGGVVGAVGCMCVAHHRWRVCHD